MSLIQVKNLTKIYKSKRYSKTLLQGIKSLLTVNSYIETVALNNISFTVEKSEKVAYLGINGSGKSTTIKILSGILFPSEGSVIIDGIIPYQNRMEHTAKIGTVFGQRTPLYWDLPVIDTLQMLKAVYKLSDIKFKKSLDKLSSLLEIDKILYYPVRQLSLGQKMKAVLVCSLIHNPKILFLDEPTIGLDVLAKERMHALINHLQVEFGTTIFLSSHDLDDIEQICDRVIVIHAGSIIYDGNIHQLKELSTCCRSLIVVVDHIKNYNFSFLNQPYEEKSNILKFDIEHYNEAYEILKMLHDSGVTIKKFNIEETVFSDIVKQLFCQKQ